MPARWDEIQSSVTDYMSLIEERLRLLLSASREEFLPVWQPPAAWKTVRVRNKDGIETDLYTHLESLRIPAPVRPGQVVPVPELLLYKLGTFSEVDDGRLDGRCNELVSGRTNM